jgi:hypothetical protein
VRIAGIIWLRNVVEKLDEKHHVSQAEVEEALQSHLRVRRIELGDVDGEDVYSALGRTGDGRYLVIFFIHKRNDYALIISARDMSPRERKHYGKK